MNRATGEAIVVRLVDYGEADRVATLLVHQHGKVAVLARGARKSRQRYVGLELFACGQAAMREGRGELWALESFDVARGFPHLPLDVARLAQAAYACELARELLPPHHPEPRAYELLRGLLEHIDGGAAAGALGPAFLRVFELGLLDALGLAPVLHRCVVCGAALEPAGDGFDPQRHFDVRRGGVVCERCGAGQGPGERALPEGARRLLVAAQQLPLGDAARLGEAPIGRAAWDAARDTLQAVLREHLGRPLRSVEFIAKLNAAAGFAGE